MNDLYWHCPACGDNEKVEPTTPAYLLGDHEPCECGGTAHVMTLREAARCEAYKARGIPYEPITYDPSGGSAKGVRE